MRISVTTTRLEVSDFDLTKHLPDNPLAFVRQGDGLIGFGEALTLTASGSDRIENLAKQWRELTEQASVSDSVNLPGSGLVAFGAIAFADSSKVTSRLIVPKLLVGKRDDRVWLTRVQIEDGAPADQNAIAGTASIDPDFFSTEQQYRAETRMDLKPGQVTEAHFEDLVSEAVAEIKAGNLNKVVLARDLQAELPENFDVRPALLKLTDRFPTCWVYSVAGSFGASPELLVRVSHGQVSARVLAGTAGRGTDPGVDQAIATALSNSEKNIREHSFAVESLVSKLEPFCDHVDAAPKPFSLALPNVWHLATDVHGVLNANSSVLDVAAALHPTAAVAGTPRDKAQQLIEKLEQVDRGLYAGPVGWIGADGDGEWAIALRGAQISDRQLVAFAGCGIVFDSEPASEFAETELKFSPIRQALASL